ncbi:MAG: DivIVA domain-containing protein [Firmicutes bacterium]|nr:DivIVA domain-containing protein [Bacillota bacterium]
MNFTEVKRGYDPDEVDSYIASLDNVIKSYKEKDNAIKNAIISAQLAADNMIKNAKLQADEYKIQIVRELENMRTEIERERAKIQEFHEVYAGLVRKYLIKLDEQDVSKVHASLNEIDRLIDLLMEVDLMPN